MSSTMSGDIDISKLDDHDLLIVVATQLGNVRGDIRELKEGTAAKITDHETRLRGIEQKLWMASGVLLALQLALKYLI